MSNERLQTVYPVTRAFACTFATAERLAPHVVSIKLIGVDVTPDDWVPWFIWDYGLEDVVPYVRDYRRVLAEGPSWQRSRGTPRGIEIGIGWVESEGDVAPSDQRHNWWEFQVAFDAPAADIDQIRQLDGIIRLSKASEDELFRMFSPGRDHRPVRLGLHRADEGLMDGYSGDPFWDGGPIISFGWSGSSELAAENALVVDAIVEVSGEVVRAEAYRMDLDRYAERAPAIVEGFADLEQTGEADAFARDTWPDRWPKSWQVAAQPRVGAAAWETT